MRIREDDFFLGKRPWSLLKDRVLKDYMTPYLAKVARLGHPILLIDGFAGPGEFVDGSSGSPLIMCEAAEQYVPRRYHAVFVNRNPVFHRQLSEALQQRGWLGAAEPVLGDATDLLRQLPADLGTHTTFIYLDPFGLRGCEFSLLEPLLQRDQRFSTEILLTLSAPIMHRLAARRASAKGRQSERHIAAFHHRLTQVFGGEYWRDSLLRDHPDNDAKLQDLMSAYCAKLRSYLPYVGCCPVREGTSMRTKYYIVFASRHKDALVLFNDIMMGAYEEHMFRTANVGTLFAEAPWREFHTPHGLQEAILAAVRAHPGCNRDEIWLRVVEGKFMTYLHGEYLSALEHLHQQEILTYSKDPRTNRRNGNSTVSLRQCSSVA